MMFFMYWAFGTIFWIIRELKKIREFLFQHVAPKKKKEARVLRSLLFNFEHQTDPDGGPPGHGGAPCASRRPGPAGNNSDKQEGMSAKFSFFFMLRIY